MSDVAKTVASAALDLVDSATSSAVSVLEATGDLAAAALQAPVHVGHRTLDAALAEFSNLQGKAMALAREIVDAVGDPLP
jgi:hypothetical protein